MKIKKEKNYLIRVKLPKTGKPMIHDVPGEHSYMLNFNFVFKTC